ncbi:MAG: hypothetical protein AB7O52_04355 [Planctomycetota bacterium]
MLRIAGRVWLGVIAGILCVETFVFAQGAPEYVLHLVPPFGAGNTNESYGHDVNDGGLAVGRSLGTVNTGWVWTPAAGASMIPDAGQSVAADGTIAGASHLYDPAGTVLLTVPPVNPSFTDIRSQFVASNHPVLGGTVILGRAINPLTGFPGPSSCFDCINPAGHTAFLWDAVGGTRDLETLGVPAAYNVGGINSNGLICGDTNDAGQDFETRAFAFDLVAGTFVDLGTLRPDNLGTASAQGVNDAGEIVGWATAPGVGGDEHAFLWTASGGLVDLGTLGPSVINIRRSRARDVNASGVVVGESTSANTVSPVAGRHAFVWDAANGMRDLNTLVALPGNYELIQANAISDTGWICGYGTGTAGGGFFSAFVLEPLMPSGVTFVRGDCNSDGATNVADGIALLNELFAGGSVLCADACDANDDGSRNIADAVRLLSVLFQGGVPLPPPASVCGVDPTADALGCGAASNCP